jgi:hypothetical protein
MVNEILIGVLISGIFLIVGIIVTIIGQFYSDKKEFQRKINYLREETFFRKKLEYFEKLAEIIQNRLLDYVQLNASISLNDPHLEQRLKNVLKLKDGLTGFIPKGAPLYFKDIKDAGIFNNKINEFIFLEVAIFREIETFSKQIKFRNKKIIFEKQPEELHQKVMQLGFKAEEILILMRKHTIVN